MKERRRAPRIELNIDVEYDMSQYQKWVEAKASNLSASGICLISSQGLTVDSELTLQFSLPDSDEAITLTGRVAWNEFSLNDDYYINGIEFTRISKENLRLIQKYISAATFDIR